MRSNGPSRIACLLGTITFCLVFSAVMFAQSDVGRFPALSETRPAL
jgi:hypothetical protein